MTLLTLFTAFTLLRPAAASESAVCDTVAHQAARETGVPLPVLRSITRVETGRARDGRFEPWPWTVNMDGTGTWFDTEAVARQYVSRHFKRGARSFDIGCFQINYKWHGDGFRSIGEMFDPLANARYAARLLLKLHAELGDWSVAAGAYHSRTPEYARRYRARFDRIRADMDRLSMPVANSSVRRPSSANGFPLLHTVDARRAPGSLVPLGASGARSLFRIGNGS